MLDLVRKALRVTAVCATATAVAVGSGATAAYAQGSKTLSLPIELNDFNADNVLFEYDIQNHASLATLGTDSEKGLVETTLGANGKPVYTRSAVESAARAMAAELNSSWSATKDTTGAAALYAALQGKLASKDASDVKLVTDTEKAYFEGDNAWKILGDGTYVPVEGNLYKDAAPAWKQQGDGVIGYDPSSTLKKTYTASELLGEDGATSLAGKNIGFYEFGDQSNVDGAEVTLECGGASVTKTLETGPYAFQLAVPADAQNADTLTVTISAGKTANRKSTFRIADIRLSASAEQLANDDGGATVDIATWNCLKQTGNQNENAEKLEEKPFYYQGWKAYDGNGNELTCSSLCATAGSTSWEQVGDGVKGSEPNTTITRTFDVVEDGVYQPRLWCGAAGIKVDFYAGDSTSGQLLGSIDTTGKGGWVNGDYITVPAGTKQVTVALTDLVAGAQISALQLITSGTSELVGSYDDTVAYYKDGSKGLSDARTCMDYVYCMLNHFFDESSLSYGDLVVKNPVSGGFTSITLNKNPESKDGTDTGYTFVADYLHSQEKSKVIDPNNGEPADGYKDLVYDTSNGTIANVAAGGGQDRAGFFPLDTLEGGQKYSSQFEFVNDAKDKANKIKAMGEHNYHYSMVSHSLFTYEQGRGQFFTFEGDDDTYLFINNKLAIDLGGAHTSETSTIALDEPVSDGSDQTWAQYLGLEDGNSYNFDFFYMERHTDYSDFAVTTNIVLSRRSLDIDVKLGEEPKDGAFREGDEVEFVVTVKNNGTDKVKVNELLGDLPGSQIDWEKSGLKEDESYVLKTGESKTLYVRYKVTKEDVKNGSIGYTVSANGEDARGNEVESPEAKISVKTAEPAAPAVPSNGSENGSGKTTKVSEVTKTVKTTKGGLAKTGDSALFIAVGVALAGGVVCALGMLLRRRHE